MVAELLFKFLNFFGYEFDYVNKQIYVDSPDDMTTHSNDAFYCVSDHMYLVLLLNNWEPIAPPDPPRPAQRQQQRRAFNPSNPTHSDGILLRDDFHPIQLQLSGSELQIQAKD